MRNASVPSTFKSPDLHLFDRHLGGGVLSAKLLGTRGLWQRDRCGRKECAAIHLQILLKSFDHPAK
jgi:hypothetical protein